MKSQKQDKVQFKKKIRKMINEMIKNKKELIKKHKPLFFSVEILSLRRGYIKGLQDLRNKLMELE